jgi:hypothetical protein
MKIVEKLPDFPQSAPKLKGLSLEAHDLLQNISPDKPVLVISPEGANVAAVKRAFAAAAKAQGGSVDTRNGENDTILVRWSSSRRTTRPGPARAPIEHSEADIEAEIRRLYASAGNKDSGYAKLSPDARRKLSISAKRNLSRRSAV